MNYEGLCLKVSRLRLRFSRVGDWGFGMRKRFYRVRWERGSRRRISRGVVLRRGGGRGFWARGWMNGRCLRWIGKTKRSVLHWIGILVFWRISTRGGLLVEDIFLLWKEWMRVLRLARRGRILGEEDARRGICGGRPGFWKVSSWR